MTPENEIPQNEIDAEVSRAGDRDAVGAASRIRARKASQLDAEKRIQDGLLPETPWRIEPEEFEIEAELARGAASREDARALAVKRLTIIASRLAKVSPGTAAEINSAQAEAEAAQQRAADLIAEQQAHLDALSNQIFALGAGRQKIQQITAVALNDTEARALAGKALEFFMVKQRDASPQNLSGFKVMCEELIYRQALTPFLADTVSPLEKTCKELVATIKSGAAEAGIDLKEFLKTVLAETPRHQRPDLADIALYDGLI